MMRKSAIDTADGRIAESLRSNAERFGHHGVKNLIETCRQRDRVMISERYARQLLTAAGYPDPKP